MTALTRISAAGIFVSLAACGCNVYDASLVGMRDAGVVLPPFDAGMVVPRDGGPCDPRHPPPRPTTADSPTALRIYFAARDITVDQGEDRWRNIGYDLDNLCSVAPDPIVECTPPRRAALETDGENGTDNVFGHVVSLLILAGVPEVETYARDNQRTGTGAILIDIRGWNGEDDDPRVDIVVAQSVFGTPGVPDGGVPVLRLPDGGGRIHFRDGGLPPFPAWSGEDYWWAGDSSFLDGNPDNPQNRDDNAYIANRTFVARLPDRQPLTFSGGTLGFALRLTDARLTGVISADGSRANDVTISGRWSIVDLLSTIESAGVCRRDPQHGIFSNVLMTSADVRSMPGSGGKGISCDAISFATVLQGYRAYPGGIAPSFALPAPCLVPDAGPVDAGSDLPDAGTSSMDAGNLDGGP